MERLRWVFLAYRLPREPSTPRITVWRKLRRLGVVQIVDGLVALPLDARTREQFEWIADEVVDAGGDSSLWIAEAGSARIERDLASQMAAAVAAEYSMVIAEAEAAATELVLPRRRTLARLRREMHRIRGRDFFPPPEADLAAVAVESLAAGFEVVVSG
jgi:hypothetical protein